MSSTLDMAALAEREASAVAERFDRPLPTGFGVYSATRMDGDSDPAASGAVSVFQYDLLNNQPSLLVDAPYRELVSVNRESYLAIDATTVYRGFYRANGVASIIKQFDAPIRSLSIASDGAHFMVSENDTIYVYTITGELLATLPPAATAAAWYTASDVLYLDNVGLQKFTLADAASTLVMENNFVGNEDLAVSSDESFVVVASPDTRTFTIYTIMTAGPVLELVEISATTYKDTTPIDVIFAEDANDFGVVAHRDGSVEVHFFNVYEPIMKQMVSLGSLELGTTAISEWNAVNLAVGSN